MTDRVRYEVASAWEDIADVGIRFDDRGLVPAIVQDATSGQILMMAWMNEESLKRTVTDRTCWFWSRSRQELWHKGETSGNILPVERVLVDCDEDTLLVIVDTENPACHTGARSCFHREIGVEEEDRS